MELKSVSSAQSLFTRSIFVRFHDLQLRFLRTVVYFYVKIAFWFWTKFKFFKDENLEQQGTSGEEQGCIKVHFMDTVQIWQGLSLSSDSDSDFVDMNKL